MIRRLGVVAVVLTVAMPGCAGESADDGTAAPSSPTTASTTAASTTAAPASTAASDDVCVQLARPVEVLNGTFSAFAGPDLEQVSSREAWDRMIAQYEANAEAMTAIGEVVPQLRGPADAAAADSAARAAAGRAVEPDLELIDRARTTSRSPVDPVEVVTRIEPTPANDSRTSDVHDYVSRVCPDLIGGG